MHRLIVRNALTGDQIGRVKDINVSKLPSSFRPRHVALQRHARLIADASTTELAISELRYVLISHSNRAIAQGKL
mgnify:CR=1 FL=1|tara:strand:- start:731 stop:955 length:225 start_codon:yes stop_codon:yes gene_type:complete